MQTVPHFAVSIESSPTSVRAERSARLTPSWASSRPRHKLRASQIHDSLARGRLMRAATPEAEIVDQ
jgi:hypothetical protein